MLAQEDSKSARLDAQVLLCFVLSGERSVLYTYPERVLTLEQERRFFELVERRLHGEPIAYITGHQEFYGLDFLVDPRVLIPRPETELLVDAALDVCRHMLDADRMPIVADIGTGSGAIPIALAVQEPRLPYIYATDISPDALDLARLNAKRHSVEQRVRFLEGDLLAPLPEPVDVLTANLPYVGTEEMEVLAPDMRLYEPHLALFSGPNGLDLLRRFFIEARRSNKIHKGARLLLEIGYRQRELLTQLLKELWPEAEVQFQKDYAGWDRVLQVTV